MKKIRLFSTKATKDVEGAEAELYVNFYLVLSKNYIFTFLIESPNLACSNRNPIKLWKHFLILFEEESVKYLRRYEKTEVQKPFKPMVEIDLYSVIKQKYIERDVLGKIKAEIKKWYWQADKQELAKDPCVVDAMIDLFIKTIDEYEAESEGNNNV